MRRLAALAFATALAGGLLLAEIQLPASGHLAGPVNDLKSSLGDDIFNYPFGKGFGAGPVHGWIAVDFDRPSGRKVRFHLRWQTVGDEPFISFATGAYFQAKAVANFNSGVQDSFGDLNLDSGEIKNLEIHAIFQNVLVHKTSRNNRFPLQSLGGRFTVLFGDFPSLEFPFPLPFSERPETFNKFNFILDGEHRITGLSFQGKSFVPITVVPNVALMSTYAFGRRGNTVIPGADGCLPGTTPAESCLSDDRFPDGLPSPDDAFLNPTLVMVSEELQEVTGPMPVPPVRPGGVATGAAAAALGNRLYVFGGFDGSKVSDRATVYDAQSNAWSVSGSAPRAAWHACAVAAAGKIYLIGGRERSDGPAVASVHVFDPGSGWSVAPALPAVSDFPACAAMNDRVYVFGGWSSASAVTRAAWVFDPAAGHWAALPPMPAPLAGAAATAAGNEIFVVNGTQDGVSATKRVFAFNPSTVTWREAPPSLRGVYGAAAAYLSGRLLVAGGRVAVNGALDVGAFLYQSQAMQALIQGKQWFAGPDPPLPIADSAGAVIGQTWYVVGGDVSPNGQSVVPQDVVQAFATARGWVISDTHPVYTSEVVRNAAGLSVGPAAIAPGALVAITGYHLAGTTRTAPPARFNGQVFTTDLPEELAGIRVTVDGTPAGMVSVAPGRIDFQVPFTLQASSEPRPVEVQVTRAGSPIAAPPVTAQLADSAPGIFNYSHGETRAIAHLDLLAAVAYNAGGRLNYGSQPAHRGEAITLRATGLGDVDSRPEPFQRASRDAVSSVLKTPEVLIDGKPATVEFARLVPGEAGIYEVKVIIPADARTGFRVPVEIRSGSIHSNRAIIVIE